MPIVDQHEDRHADVPIIGKYRKTDLELDEVGHLLDGHPFLRLAVAHAEILAAFVGVMPADWLSRHKSEA